MLSAVETSRDGGGVDLLRDLRAAPGSWHAFGVEIAHTQDPREQAKIVLQLIALGLHRGQPGTRWMDPLAQKWLRTVPGLRSPHAIADLIRMFTAWDQSTGAAMANAVNTVKQTSRLAEGAAPDLRAAWRIMSAFVLAWREDRYRTMIRDSVSFLSPTLDTQRCRSRDRPMTSPHQLDAALGDQRTGRGGASRSWSVAWRN